MQNMALDKNHNKELFFRAVTEGSISELLKLEEKIGLKETSMLAKSFNEHGETPLLLATKRNEEEIIDFVMKELEAVEVCQLGRFSWEGLDYMDAPPLFAAVICGSIEVLNALLQKSILVSMNSIVESDTINRQQKIDFLEVIGAAYLLRQIADGTAYWPFLEKGLKCWHGAMVLRHSTDEGGPSIPKIPPPLSERAQKVLNVSEVTTMEELEQQISIVQQINVESVEIQALLTVCRIFNQIHLFHPSRFLLQKLSHYCRRLKTQQRYNRMIDVCLLILELSYINESNYAMVWPFFNSTLGWLCLSFTKLQELPCNSSDRCEGLSFTNYMDSLKRAAAFFDLQPTLVHGKYMMDFISAVVEMLPRLKQEEIKEFEKWLSHYNKCFNENSSITSPLHLAIRRMFTVQDEGALQIEVVRQLLKFGANPNSTDIKGETPLYILFHYDLWNSSESERKCKFVVAQLLLDAGAHLDLPNSRGKTFLDIVKLDDFKSLTGSHRVPSLQCHCAQALRHHGIPFAADRIPSALTAFLEMHGAKSDPK